MTQKLKESGEPGDWELAKAFVEFTGEHLFITGKAGTGKTTFLRELNQETCKKHIILAPTGISAINAQGVTLNSFFQLPPGYYFPLAETTPELGIYSIRQIVEGLNYSISKRKLINEIESIIIDEVSMIRPDQMDLIDEILRKHRNSDTPFGGVQLILIGDLFQLPPVITAECEVSFKKSYSSHFFFEANVFQAAKLIQLEFTKVFRQSDTRFIQVLNEIRSNAITGETLGYLNQRYRKDFTPEEGDNYIIITSHNSEALKRNLERLQSLPGEECNYNAIIKGDFKQANFPVDQILRLKIGAQVMFVKNDSGEDRKFYNGKIGKITGLHEDSIDIQFTDATTLKVERSVWHNLDYQMQSEGLISTRSIGEFHQFPIRLAWAVTIHKSQGLTFDKAIIDAEQSFAPGQVYVALSRVKTFDGLILHSNITENSVKSSSKVVEFLSSESAHSLEEKLFEAKRKFLLTTLVKKFSLRKTIQVLSELSVKPETFKQKIGTDVLLILEDLHEKMKKLEHVFQLFELEICKTDWANPDWNSLLNRFKAANLYYDQRIQELYFSRNFPEVISNTAQQYLQTIRQLIDEQGRKRSKTLDLLQHLAEGIPIENLIAKSNKNVEKAKVEHEKNQQKQPRKGTLSNSVKGTVSLFVAGKTTNEIATTRNLGVNTIETHLLEALKMGVIEISQVLDGDKLRTIQQEIENSGRDIYDLKDKLGNHVSFFEIRCAITAAELGA